MDNSPLFLRLHREEYLKRLDDCDPHIRNKILSNPHCVEGKALEVLVEAQVKLLLGAKFPSVQEAFEEIV
jgi:hypothetical protein